ncbi:MAG: class I SAM-dependent methyltransferase, partial [Acidimicrobiales bacterium]
MTSTDNTDQREAWNGDSGLRWVADADRRDRVLAPVADALLRAAAPRAGEQVLDVGCGCGVTTLAAGQAVGSSGAATGVDLSAPMLALARERRDDADLRHVEFMEGDAQVHDLGGLHDLVLSRFGTMFFADPTAAFTNIASALRSGGRLCLATWQPLVANEWLLVPGAVLLQYG